MLQDQPFRIVELTKVGQITKEYVVWCKPAYGEQFTIQGVIKWHTAYFGFVYEQESLGAVAHNVLAEVMYLVYCLNNNRTNSHISVNTNPF